jgi:hypothetical protein
VDIVNSSGTATPVLAIIADGGFSILSGGSVSTPVAELTVDGVVVSFAGTTISLTSGTVPSSAILCSAHQRVYAIDDSGSAYIDMTSGEIGSFAASSGTLPTGVSAAFVYRDRLGLVSENGVYLSRQGDFTDWHLGADLSDASRPVLFQLSEASLAGAAPTAAVPFKDAAVILATRRSLWVVSGDPAAGGSLRCVSKGIGMVSANACCKIEDNQVGDPLVRDGIAFLSEGGLFLVTPNGDGLLDLSRDRLPQDLQDIAADTAVNMVYNPDERGIHIFTLTSGGAAASYFFDLANKGFWPDFWQTDHHPSDVCVYDGDVVLAGSDGYLRLVGGDDDDGTDIESHVLIGPLRLATPGTFGRVNSLRAALAEDSDSVTWRFVLGDTAEEACENAKTAIALYQAGDTAGAAQYVEWSGDFLAGRNSIVYPRSRAEWLVVWLQSTGKWGYETVILETDQSGKVR